MGASSAMVVTRSQCYEYGKQFALFGIAVIFMQLAAMAWQPFRVNATVPGDLRVLIIRAGLGQHVRLIAAPSNLPNFVKLRRLATVGTMNISLPDELRDFVEEQVKRGYSTSSEYVRELIRRDQDRLSLRSLLLAGAASPAAPPADGTYFKGLRNRLRAERATRRRR